eukprot:SAG11_NODE_1330_length_5187_cov_6.700079_2_plen_153_part_00
MTKLNDDMEKLLGSRLNKRQGLQGDHYAMFQRALCGVSSDADFGAIGAAWRGPWSTEIKSEVVAQVNRLQHSTGFRHFEVANLPINSVVFESVFGGSPLPPRNPVAPQPSSASGGPSGATRPASDMVTGGDLLSVKQSFAKQLSGMEERHAK